jgi:enoyl-CoA hydratase/carnithine racemase
MSVITVTRPEEGIRVVTLDREAKRNAFSNAMVGGLERALREFEQSEDRVLVLRAEGDHFSAGADLAEPPKDFWKALPGMGVTVTKPVVCAVQGWTVGMGFTLAMMSDLIVAADDTKFSFPEARVGVFGGVAAALVVRVPQKVAVEFLMLGQPMPAQRAYEVGMVNRVVPRHALQETALEMARSLRGMAPKVLAAIKHWTGQTLPKAPAEVFSVEAGRVAEMMASHDFQEGMASFRERRPARFTGT